MSLICLSGDWHLRSKDLSQKLIVIEEMLRICKERRVDHLFNGGDTFDVGEVGINPEKTIKALTDLWSKYQIPSTFIAGNHDRHSAGCALDYLHHPYINVIDESRFGDFPDFEMFYIPWVDNDKDYYQKAMTQMTLCRGANKPRYVLGHLNIIGCSIGSHGYCSAEHYYSFGLPDMQNSNYAPDKMFFSHIHAKQHLGGGAHYLGALTQLRFHEDEGKEAGFHLLDTETNTLEFVNLDYCSPQYFTIQEHQLPNYDVKKDFVRFHTDHVEKYDHLKPNVKAIRKKLAKDYSPKDVANFQDLSSGQLDTNQLVSKYCEVKSLKEPTSTFYLGEKKNLQLTLANKMTGLDFIYNVHMKKLGVHTNTYVEFERGFNVIYGANGKGKTTVLNAILGALYETVPERGNIKNMMEKGGYIEVNLQAKGMDYQITKSLDNKRFVSSINDTEYALVGNFAGAIEPIFGDSNIFTKLVYMDQNNKFDLVTTADSKRLEVLRKLLDLDAFEAKQEAYKKEMKECQTRLANLSALDQEIKELAQEYDEMLLADIHPFSQDMYDKLKRTLAQMKAENKEAEKDLIARRQYEEIVKFEDSQDPQDYWDKEKRLKLVKEEITLLKGWNDVGCKTSPLPCMFLKGKAKAQGHNLEDLEAEADFLQDYLKSNGWPNYKHLKYIVKPEIKFSPSHSQETMDEIQEQISELERFKGAKEATEALIRANEAVGKRLASKKALRGSESLEELEEKITDLRFLVDLCGKNGLSLLVIDLVKIELQNIINELIDFSELDLDIELSTSKKEDLDSFQILFGPKKIDISKASGGEIALVRLMFKLALMTYLNRYFGAYKVLLIDEGSAACDSDNTDAIVNVMKKLCKEFNQIVFITHSNRIINAADHKVVL